MYALAPLARQKSGYTHSVFVDAQKSRACEQDGCAPKRCFHLHDLGVPKSYKANDTIFWESDGAESYLLIEAGMVRGCRVMSDGRRQICRFMFPGDFVAHAHHGSYPYTAEAVTPVRIRAIPRSVLDQRAEAVPCLQNLLLTNLQDELRETQDQVLVLGRMNAPERVAHFLCMLARRTNSNPVEIPMSRVDIADYLGLTLETISRVISRLKREGKIKLLSPNKIHICAEMQSLADCRNLAA